MSSKTETYSTVSYLPIRLSLYSLVQEKAPAYYASRGAFGQIESLCEKIISQSKAGYEETSLALKEMEQLVENSDKDKEFDPDGGICDGLEEWEIYLKNEYKLANSGLSRLGKEIRRLDCVQELSSTLGSLSHDIIAQMQKIRWDIMIRDGAIAAQIQERREAV